MSGACSGGAHLQDGVEDGAEKLQPGEHVAEELHRAVVGLDSLGNICYEIRTPQQQSIARTEG